MNRITTLLVALCACMAFFVTAPGAFAASGTPGTVFPASSTVQVKGTIIDFSPISLTIRNTTRDVRAVRLTASTEYYTNGQPAAHPTFHYGEHVMTQAHREADGSLNALTVSLGTTTNPGVARFGGAITDFSPASLTVKTTTNDVFGVRLTATTKYFVNGLSVASKPQFNDGEHVHIAAQREQDGSLNALRVYLGTTAQQGNKRVVGTIIDFSPISFTIRTTANDVFGIELTGNTKYFVDGRSVVQKPDIRYGEHVSVLAHLDANGSLNALTVHVGITPLTGNARVAGTIIDFSAVSLTIRTKSGDVFAVKLVATTKYAVNGQPVSPRPGFHYGEHVGVLTHQEADGSRNALRVNVPTN